MNELKKLCQTSLGKAVAARRQLWWQRPRRQLQVRVRRRAVDFYQLRRRQGSTLREVARRLRVRPRTLRQWDYACRRPNWLAAPLGRPRARSEYRQRNQVIEVLKAEGPTLGVPALRAIFPGMARAELTELVRRYRRVLHERYRATIRVCHWPVPGRVWSMDLAEPSESAADECLPPIDGCYPYLLAVRDLASGYQLAWQPLKEATAAAVRIALAYLFARQGAPLVLKSDNGPPLRAEEMKAFLKSARVVALYSPPYYPEYNGSIEAGIGSLKRRTELQAARHGALGVWSWNDVEAARQEANRWTAADAHTNRTPIPDWERACFELTVQREHMLERTQQEIGLADQLDHWHHAMVDRKAIDRALVEHGYLLYSRRRIPLALKSQKVTNIR